MKAVAINGSPRRGGNTEILLKKVLEPLSKAGWETELIQLGGKKIRGCTACYRCFNTKDGRCSVKTDVFNDCLGKDLAADAIILGSPTYFTDVTAEMKALIDRSGLVSVANGRPAQGKDRGIGGRGAAGRGHARFRYHEPHVSSCPAPSSPGRPTGTLVSAWRKATWPGIRRACGTWRTWAGPSPGWERR